MTNTQDPQPEMPSETPFPLSRLFRRRFVPAFLAFAAIFVVLINFTANEVLERIYLELAQRRAQTIADAVSETAPEAWEALVSGRTMTELSETPHAVALTEAFAEKERQMQLIELKVYDRDRRTLYSTDTEDIGILEDSPVLQAAFENANSRIITEIEDGVRQYELYVPVFDAQDQVRAVFELYEPVSYLDAILLRAAIPTAAVPAGLLLTLILALNVLVGRAQGDIDQRTAALKALQARLASFMSKTATSAARNADSGGGIESRKLETTLFCSDVRSFTGFSEQNPPEVVVAFLNRIMALQVATIEKHGGDVDKMIGDAVLARFDGADGKRSAIASSREILRAVRDGGFPRGLGIGVHRGEVISGAVGPEDRRDFTVIGDTVNITARLCSAAEVGELVASAGLADTDFGPVETIAIKGRLEGLAVRRWRAD